MFFPENEVYRYIRDKIRLIAHRKMYQKAFCNAALFVISVCLTNFWFNCLRLLRENGWLLCHGVYNNAPYYILNVIQGAGRRSAAK